MTAGARVLIVLGTSAAWSRGILRGFSSAAHEQGWILLHYHPHINLDWLVREWNPEAVVLGPEWTGAWPAALRSRTSVSVNADRSAEGVGSVCLDEERIADVALEHLRSTGLTNLATFRFDDSAFAVARDRRFRRQAPRVGARMVAAWWADGAEPARRHEVPATMIAWLRALPKPCGVFACCDSWSRVIARYARVAGLRVPEDLAIIGADNDPTECELSAPPLSSVAIPWRRVGEEAAALVRRSLAGGAIARRRTVVTPGPVVVRRSSDVLAIQDAVAAAAVAWIRAHARGRISVPSVAVAAHVSRQRLERRFRAVLGRTVMQEIRRARVELAKRVLATTRLGLPAVAERSGFTSAALLNAAFQRELGMTPGAYRRMVQGTLAAVPDD
jgi:LacI family transcriptional regulator